MMLNETTENDLVVNMEPAQQTTNDQVDHREPTTSAMMETTNSRPNPAYPSTSQLTDDFADEQNFDAFQKLGNELNYRIKTLERTHLSKLNLLARIRHEVEGLRQKRNLQRATMEELQTRVESLTLTKKAAEQKKYADRKNNLEFLRMEFEAVSENYAYIENVIEKIQSLLENDEGNSMNLLGDIASECAAQLSKSSDFKMEIEKCHRIFHGKTGEILEEKKLYKASLLETLRLCKDLASDKEMFEVERREKLSTVRALDRENEDSNARILECTQKLRELNGTLAQLSADWKSDREIRYEALAKIKTTIDSKRQLVNSRLQALESDQQGVESESEEQDDVKNQIAAADSRLESIADEIQKMTADVSEIRDEDRSALCDNLEANDAPLADILEHLTGEISGVQKEMIESLLLVNGDANSKELKLAACEENLASMKFQIDMLKHEMSEKTKEFEDIKGKLGDLRAKLVLLENDEKLKELQNKIDKSKDHYEALVKKISSTKENLKKADSEIKVLEVEIVSLDDQLAGLVAKEEQIAMTRTEDDLRLEGVQRAIEESRRDVEEIKNKIESRMKEQDVEDDIKQVSSDLEKRKNENAEEIARMKAKLDDERLRAQENVKRLQLSFEESMKPFSREIDQTEKKISRMEDELNDDANRLSASTQMTIDMIKERLSLVDKLIEEFGRLERRARIKKEMSRSLQVMAKIKEHLSTTFQGINKCLDMPSFVGTPSYAIYRRQLDIFQKRSMEFDSARKTRCSDPDYQQELADWAFNFFGIRSFSGFGSELFSSPDFDFY